MTGKEPDYGCTLTNVDALDTTFEHVIEELHALSLTRRDTLDIFASGGGLAVLMGLVGQHYLNRTPVEESLERILAESDGPNGVRHAKTPKYEVDDEIYERHPAYNVDFMYTSEVAKWIDFEGGQIAHEAELLADGLENASTVIGSGRPYTDELPGKDSGYVRAHQALYYGLKSLLDAIQGYSFSRTDGRLDIQKEIAEGGHFTPDHLVEREPDVTDPDQLRDMLDTVSRLAGSGDLGVGELDKRWIYSHRQDGAPIEFDDIEEPIIDDERTVIPESMDRTVVGVSEMPKEVLRTGPTPASAGATALGYGRMGVEATIVATWIRAMGYNAIPALNDTGLSVPMAIDAGLGEGGRHGRLIHPQFGSNLRLWKILTDMPLDVDPYIRFWVWEFCEELCRICAANCPSGQLTNKKSPTWRYRGETPESWTAVSDVPWDITKANGVKKWYESPMRCLRFWMENGAECTNCTVVCPFTHGRKWLDEIFFQFAPNIMSGQTTMADYLSEYGTYDEPNFSERWISQVMTTAPETIWEQDYLPFGLTQDRSLSPLFDPPEIPADVQPPTPQPGAIAGDRQHETTPDEQPGFGLAAAIASLGGVAYVLKRRLGSSGEDHQ